MIRDLKTEMAGQGLTEQQLDALAAQRGGGGGKGDKGTKATRGGRGSGGGAGSSKRRGEQPIAAPKAGAGAAAAAAGLKSGGSRRVEPQRVGGTDSGVEEVAEEEVEEAGVSRAGVPDETGEGGDGAFSFDLFGDGEGGAGDAGAGAGPAPGDKLKAEEAGEAFSLPGLFDDDGGGGGGGGDAPAAAPQSALLKAAAAAAEVVGPWGAYGGGGGGGKKGKKKAPPAPPPQVRGRIRSFTCVLSKNVVLHRPAARCARKGTFMRVPATRRRQMCAYFRPCPWAFHPFTRFTRCYLHPHTNAHRSRPRPPARCCPSCASGRAGGSRATSAWRGWHRSSSRRGLRRQAVHATATMRSLT